MSLLQNIQTELASSQADIASVLLKCKILASRLDSQNFARWTAHELNGYSENDPVPDYRQLGCGLYGHFINAAWQIPKQSIPLFAIPEENRTSFQRVEFKEGLAKATLFTNEGATINRTELIPLLQGKVYPDMACIAIWMTIPGPEFVQLISSVKSRILDFILELERVNPMAGEPSSRQAVPPEKVNAMVNNYFLGQVGNVAQHSPKVHQVANIGSTTLELSKLVTMLTQHLDDLKLDAHSKRRIEGQIAVLSAELEGEPDHIIVTESLKTLRSLTENVIGNLVTNPLATWAVQMWAMLNQQ